MKLVTAVVQPFTLGDIRHALSEAGVKGITVTEAQGAGRQMASVEYYRGARYTSNFVQKVKVEVLVTDSQEDAAVNAILNAAHTGEVGDGKIWVTEVTRAVRVRTGEEDDAAI
ncbi:P-II family nitrogen regulator [Corynebacterium tuscaniense]|uniref:P-II family nitrogen regulator n=1 Tax=Corynebacterium tuscaniense TaxID=302449 RepID=UPI001239B862|nr:P-II family nitrogen regulator [Corynebacterium tuscaniense]KAA8746776.1 P-II family nitrogen regulator [Corynebacterium tuscaniense]